MKDVSRPARSVLTRVGLVALALGGLYLTLRLPLAGRLLPPFGLTATLSVLVVFQLNVVVPPATRGFGEAVKLVIVGGESTPLTVTVVVAVAIAAPSVMV